MHSPVVLELLAQFARGVERVVLDHDCAKAKHRVERDDVLRAVGQHDRDGVAVRDTKLAQTASGTLDLGKKFGVARRATEELERRSIRVVTG